MWAQMILAVLVTGSLAFLGYFEFAMIRELRRAPKRWKLVSRTRTDWSHNDSKPRIVVFELTPPDRRSRAVRAAR